LADAACIFPFLRRTGKRRPVLIRPAQLGDHDTIWRILEPVIRAGETYPLPPDMSKAGAIEYWIRPDRETFVAEEDGRLVGTYYLRANQLGGGGHVANCGYITASDATGGEWHAGCANTRCNTLAIAASGRFSSTSLSAPTNEPYICGAALALRRLAVCHWHLSTHAMAMLTPSLCSARFEQRKLQAISGDQSYILHPCWQRAQPSKRCRCASGTRPKNRSI
jgi:hypothetical protein